MPGGDAGLTARSSLEDVLHQSNDGRDPSSVSRGRATAAISVLVSLSIFDGAACERWVDASSPDKAAVGAEAAPGFVVRAPSQDERQMFDELRSTDIRYLRMDADLGDAPRRFLAEYRAAQCRRTIRRDASPEGSGSDAVVQWCHPQVVPSSAPYMPRLVPECFGEIYFNPALAYRCLLALEQDDGVNAVPAEYWTCYFVFTSHASLEPACVPGACPAGMECGVRRNCVGCLPRCEPSLPEGAPCELVMPLYLDTCGPGLRCVPTPAGPTCTRARGRGEACSEVAPCERAFLCMAGRCKEARSPEGSPCNSRCRGGSVCVEHADGARRCSSGARPGERCVEGWASRTPRDPPPCVPGARCVDGVCARVAFPGQTCRDDHTTCPDSFECADGVCVPTPRPDAVGAPPATGCWCRGLCP